MVLKLFVTISLIAIVCFIMYHQFSLTLLYADDFTESNVNDSIDGSDQHADVVIPSNNLSYLSRPLNSM